MPEDNPGSLSVEQAEAIARYMHGDFYSNVARERNKPVRVELSRLTVRQYRQSVADLVGSFRGESAQWGNERGLKAEYFKGRSMDGRNRVLERIDPQVDFQFGTEAPVAEKIEPHEYSIRWYGSLLAPETGEYEFVVRTEQATRLWVNDQREPLIDRWVKSGTDSEFTASIFLVGGRVYPLKLDFSKAKQGVNDSDKQKKPPPSVPASMTLLWKRPGSGLEVVPNRQLSTNSAREEYVCAIPFPPDDRSYGWERGTSISKAWDQATTAGAIDVAGYLSRKVNDLAGTKLDDENRVEKIRNLARRFAERAYRRPLSDEQVQILVDKQFAAVTDPVLALKRTVVLSLKSPEFLYREVADQNDAFDVAARLSYGLWDSIPDEPLWQAAAQGKLSTKEQVAQQADRMLNDVRARGKLRQFLLTWLKADGVLDLSKDPELYPGFEPAVIADLKASLEIFLEDVFWSEASDYRQLLTADELFLNERLTKFYGVEGGTPHVFAKTRVNADQRAGVLTHPYLLASFAHRDASSPIHRGVFLVRGVLGLTLKPPPDAVTPIPPDLHPSLTTRERVALQTKGANCMTCHSLINPLGFTLERFDAVGRYREQDREKPIDASGSYRPAEGARVEFNGARELANYLVTSPEAHHAFTTQMFHFLVQQSARAYGPETTAQLTKSFVEHNFHMRQLAVQVMVSSALTGRGTIVTSATP